MPFFFFTAFAPALISNSSASSGESAPTVIERFKDSLHRFEKSPRVLILRMRLAPSIDATGLQVLEDVLARTRREGGTLLLTGVAEQPLRALEQSGLLEKLRRENVMENIDAALARANTLLNQPPA